MKKIIFMLLVSINLFGGFIDSVGPEVLKRAPLESFNYYISISGASSKNSYINDKNLEFSEAGIGIGLSMCFKNSVFIEGEAEYSYLILDKGNSSGFNLLSKVGYRFQNNIGFYGLIDIGILDSDVGTGVGFGVNYKLTKKYIIGIEYRSLYLSTTSKSYSYETKRIYLKYNF